MSTRIRPNVKEKYYAAYEAALARANAALVKIAEIKLVNRVVTTSGWYEVVVPDGDPPAWVWVRVDAIGGKIARWSPRVTRNVEAERDLEEAAFDLLTEETAADHWSVSDMASNQHDRGVVPRIQERP